MSWRYKDHLNADNGQGERLRDCPERVTRLTFDQWLTFYQGDPEHWIDYENYNYVSGSHSYHLPVYKKITNSNIRRKDGGWGKVTEYIYIKFLTRADFRKYHNYIKAILKNGQDFENLREIQELAEHIGKIAEKRLRETQERTQKAIDENKRLMEETRLKIKAQGKEGEVYEFSF